MRFLLMSASMALLVGLGGCATDISGGVGDGAGAAVDVSTDLTANIAPPPLPLYDQPPIPGDGYIWTPGYWAWNADISNYYWVPGTWVLPPQAGFLWTPGYWAWRDGIYAFSAGYWGPHVGFYGGINYGFGYGGLGFSGGEWRGRHFFYNRSVTNISNVNITNVYSRTVINSTTTRVSFNGGGGVQARARPEELAAAHETHILATPEQERHVQGARADPSLRENINHGAPAIGATAHAGVIHNGGAGDVARGEVMSRPAAGEHPPMGEPQGPEAHTRPEGGGQPGAERRPAEPQAFGRQPADARRVGAPIGRPFPGGDRPGGRHPGGRPPSGRFPGGGHPAGGGHKGPQR